VIIGFEVILGLIILVYAFYITLLPLFKTIQGGLQVLNERRKQQLRIAINEGYDFMFDARVGFTMTDGGNSAEGKVSVDEG
jgi:hypothetical protein